MDVTRLTGKELYELERGLMELTHTPRQAACFWRLGRLAWRLEEWEMELRKRLVEPMSEEEFTAQMEARAGAIPDEAAEEEALRRLETLRLDELDGAQREREERAFRRLAARLT